MKRPRNKVNDVSRRKYLKTLGGVGIILGSVGTGITAAHTDQQKKCPKGLDITYTRKGGKWSPSTNENTSNDVGPDKFWVGGTKKKIWICSRYPFAVTDYVREKHNKKNSSDEDDDKHSTPENSDDCKKHKTVRAEMVDGYYRVAIKDKKKEICCFRVHCPKRRKDRDKDHDKDRDKDHDKDRDKDHDKGKDKDHDKDCDKGKDKDKDCDKDRDKDRDKGKDKDKDRDKDHDKDRDKEC